MAFVWLYYDKFDKMHAAFGYFLHWFYPIYLLIAFALPKVKSKKSNVTKVSAPANQKMTKS